MSSYWQWLPAVWQFTVLFPFVKVPITLNATGPPVGTPVGPPGTVVLVAAGRGVNVGVCFGVRVGDPDGEGVNVGEVGGPLAIVMASSA
jgi:hypothetical protein